MELEILSVCSMELSIDEDREEPLDIGVNDTPNYLPPVYDGETVVTPSEIEQVLSTINHIVLNNIVIAPIPSNYGRIIYNGSNIRIE